MIFLYTAALLGLAGGCGWTELQHSTGGSTGETVTDQSGHPAAAAARLLQQTSQPWEPMRLVPVYIDNLAGMTNATLRAYLQNDIVPAGLARISVRGGRRAL